MKHQEKAAESAESKQDMVYLSLAVFVTLFAISVLMVSVIYSFQRFWNVVDGFQIGTAFLAGARFDIAFSELLKGNIFPKWGQQAQAIVQRQNRVEL